MSDAETLVKHVRGHAPLVIIDTLDEQTALSSAADCALQLNIPLFCWSSAKGLMAIRPSVDTEIKFGTTTTVHGEPLTATAALKEVTNLPSPSIVVFCDLHHYLSQNIGNVRILKEHVYANDAHPRTIILLGKNIDLPADLSSLSTTVSLPLPTEIELLEMLKEEGAKWVEMQALSKIKVEPGILQKLVRNLRGLSFSDARRLVRQIVRIDNVLNDEDVASLVSEKFKILGMEGIVSFEEDVRGLKDVGGLNKLKSWLELRKEFWHGSDELKDRPRGVLLLGVQGGGKSLAARVIAGCWGLPLLQVNAGALYNKYIGETERNLRDVLSLADAMSPCVVWIDEIEKGFATDDNDGTSKRVLGTLLTWMAENKKKVFLVATANDVSRLPPELMRKGRIDEIFFVDLPNTMAREQIFMIHLEKRALPLSEFNAAALSAASEGFSGAEIEQAIVSAGFSSKSLGVSLNQALLIHELSSTKPLSIVRAEEIAALRLWASDRTVAAD